MLKYNAEIVRNEINDHAYVCTAYFPLFTRGCLLW